MAEWHLDRLYKALAGRGWSVAIADPDGHPLSDGVWALTRGVVLHLELNRFDPDGGDLVHSDQAHCVHVRETGGGLYFYRKASPRWEPALATFVEALDRVGRSESAGLPDHS